MLIKVPPVSDAPRSVGKLLTLLEPAWMAPEEVILDFERATFVEPTCIAILTLLKLHRERHGWQTSIDWMSLRGAVRKQLGRWEFADRFGQPSYPWTDNAIPLLCQETKDPIQTQNYLESRVLPACPPMSLDVRKRMVGSFSELFHNIFRHAHSRVGGVAVGQVYPNARRVQFCIADAGLGIVQRVQNAGFAEDDAAAAVRWALQKGNSTDEGPGGLGLYQVREFALSAGGNFRIYANGICFTETATQVAVIPLETPFDGSLIDLRLNLGHHVI